MDFFEELKSRGQDAARRVAEAQKELQAAQTKFQAVAQEHNSIQHLIAVEQANRTNEKQKEFFPIDQKPDLTPQSEPLPAENQTDAVRKILSQHPTGITPSDMWKQLRTQIKYRAYFYSILKRLRDKDQVIVRRGKYFLKLVPKAEETKGQAAIH